MAPSNNNSNPSNNNKGVHHNVTIIFDDSMTLTFLLIIDYGYCYAYERTFVIFSNQNSQIKITK